MRADIRTWHSNIEQHASDGVNKILVGNKCDWEEKRAITSEAGRELAEELGVKFMETSAKVNLGVEDAFFTLARCVTPLSPPHLTKADSVFCRDIKTRLIDSQPDAGASAPSAASNSVNVARTNTQPAAGCC